MFLLPSLAVGLIFALLLGGQPWKVLALELRHGWLVLSSLTLQLLLLSPLSQPFSALTEAVVHLISYALLLAFAAANMRHLVLLPLFVGIFLNAAAIFVNGGQMPVSASAWHAAGIEAGATSNVRLGADHLGFLGDVFALPRSLPLANVFSVGDLLIGVGMVAFIVSVSTGEGSVRQISPGRLIRPLRVTSFRRLAAGKLVSHLGDWLTLAALVGWVYDATGSTAQVAVLMLTRIAPPIVGAGVAAAVVDRLRKERLLVRLEVLRGLTVAAALSGVVLDIRPIAFVAVALSGGLAAMSTATVRSLVPSLLDDEDFPAANAGLGIAQDAAMAIGALGAGIALAESNAAVALGVALGTFAAATLLYLGIRTRAISLPSRTSESGLVAGLRYLLSRRLLLVIVVAFGAATLATGLANATLPRLLDSELGLGRGAYGFGLAALAGGLALGEAVVGVARIGKTGGRWIGVALLFMAGLFVCLALTEHGPTALLVLGLIGFLDGTTDVLFDTIVQREADPSYYGRVFGFASVFMMSTMMGAVATAPLVNRVAPPRDAILLGAFCLVLGAFAALAGTRRPLAARVAPAG